MIDPRLVLLGTLLQFIGTSSYLIDTFKGKAKPNRVSWLLWAVGPLIAFGAELDHGVTWVALMTFSVGFMPLLVLLASFVSRKAAWKLTKLDIVCGILSIGGLLLWQITGNGYLAILFSILADVLAWIPTFLKSYKYPDTENWHFFLFDALAAGIALLAIDKWDFAHWGFPIWIFASCVILAITIKFKIGVNASSIDKIIKTEDEKPF